MSTSATAFVLRWLIRINAAEHLTDFSIYFFYLAENRTSGLSVEQARAIFVCTWARSRLLQPPQLTTSCHSDRLWAYIDSDPAGQRSQYNQLESIKKR
jgi:hypothetical protein